MQIPILSPIKANLQNDLKADFIFTKDNLAVKFYASARPHAAVIEAAFSLIKLQPLKLSPGGRELSASSADDQIITPGCRGIMEMFPAYDCYGIIYPETCLLWGSNAFIK